MSAKRAFFCIFQKFMVICCAIFFGFADAFSANLPSGYTELEYIESTGTQYIDTGVILDKLASEVFINFKKTNDTDNVSLMGCQDTSASYNLRQTYFYASGALRFYNSTSTSYSNLGGVANNVKHTIHTIVDNNNNVTLNIDGVTKTFTQQSGMSDNRLKLYLFANNSNGSAIQKVSAQMYSVWIRNSSGTLVFNGIPAKRNGDDVIGMYDTVSGNFFTNKGTGTFTAGPVVGIRIATTTYNNAQFNPVVTDLNTTIATIRDVVTNTINQTKAIADLQAKKQTRPDEQCPAGKKCLLVEDNDGVPHWYEIIENIYGLPTGYTPLEYIQSTGTQWIDTGLKGNQNTKVEIKWQYTETTTASSSGRIFGSRTGSSSNAFVIGSSTGTAISTTDYFFAYDNQNYLQTGRELYFGEWTTIIHDRLTHSVNGINYTKNYASEVFETPQNLKIFGYDNGGTMGSGRGMCAYCKIWDGNTLVRNFVPAKRNSDNAIGMYDLVNDVFYTNSGTGTFTAGPEI